MAEEALEEGPEHCPHCGKEVVGEFDFCPYCGRGLRVMKIPHIAFHPHSEKKCPKCSATIDTSFEYCSYCGHKQDSPMAHEVSPTSTKMLVFYLLSFLIPPVGVIIWLAWKKASEGETRNEAEYCLGAAFLGLVVYVTIETIFF